MKVADNLLISWGTRFWRAAAIAILCVALLGGCASSNSSDGNDAASFPSSRNSTLASGDAITDPTALLRYALPIDNKHVRNLQASVEDISQQLRGKRWSPLAKDVKDASRVVSFSGEKILAAIPESDRPQAQGLLDEIRETLTQLKTEVDERDKEQIWTLRREILNRLDVIENMMVQEFPYEVPKEYADLPQLKGRATVEVETTQGAMTMVVDGYSAPVNAGNFIDLVTRHFYDGLEFVRADDFVVQTGNPPGESEGFIDPQTGEYRAIPLEVMVRGDRQPTYGVTLEDAGRYQEDPVLPFSAYGTVALARPSVDPNGGSSQFFFFKFDTELTPPGFNLMDGRYSVLGYVVEGAEILDKITTDDKVIEARVISGEDNLVLPEA